MSYITTRKRQLDRAFKDYKNNQRGKAKAKKRLDICQTKYSEITNRTTVSARNIVVAGMLYFDERKREELLAEAEQLNYSRETLMISTATTLAKQQKITTLMKRLIKLMKNFRKLTFVNFFTSISLTHLRKTLSL